MAVPPAANGSNVDQRLLQRVRNRAQFALYARREVTNELFRQRVSKAVWEYHSAL
jgi:hypothetical protein